MQPESPIRTAGKRKLFMNKGSGQFIHFFGQISVTLRLLFCPAVCYNQAVIL